MKVACIVDSEDKTSEAVAKVTALGHVGFATEDISWIAVDALKNNGFILVTEQPSLLSKIRREIQICQITVGDFKALASGRLATR